MSRRLARGASGCPSGHSARSDRVRLMPSVRTATRRPLSRSSATARALSAAGPSPRRAAARIAAVEPSSRRERGPPHAPSASSRTSRVPRPRLADDQLSGRQFGARHRGLPPGPGMRRVHHDHQVITAHHDRRHAAQPGLVTLHEPHINMPFPHPGQHLRRVGHLHRQDHLRGLTVQRREPAREQMFSHGERGRDPQPR